MSGHSLLTDRVQLPLRSRQWFSLWAIFFFIFSLPLTECCTAQVKEARALTESRREYDRGNYSAAFTRLLAIDRNRLADSLLPVYQYQLGSAAFALDSLEIARRELNAVATSEQLRLQLPFIHLRLGHIAVRLGRPSDAITFYVRAWSGADQSVRLLSFESLRTLLGRIDLDISSAVPPVEINSVQFCALVKELGGSGKRLSQLPGFAPLAVDCRTPLGNTSGKVNLGLVLPFSGENAEFASQIAAGVEFALRALGMTEQVKLLRFDTRSRVVEAARIVTQIPDTVCDLVIGPLTSEECAAFALASRGFARPIIVPAASDVGLTELHPQLFQLTPSLASEAMLMAMSAREFLGADTAVVLVPSSEDYEMLADLFIREFTARGGTILLRRTYDPRQRDFGAMLGDLKIAVGHGSDSSKVMLNAAGDTLKPEHQPGGVDCLYLPCSATQARALLPQLAFYTVEGALLGSTAWNDKSVFADASSIVAQSFFPAALNDRGCDRGELFLAQRAGGKRKAGNEHQDRLERLGFDAMLLAARLIADPGLLTEGSRDCGAAGMIAFGADRTNNSLSLCQWRNNAAVPAGNR